MWWSKTKEGEKTSGGLAFYASLFFLVLLSANNILALRSLARAGGIGNFAYFALAASIGAVIASLLVRNELSVFIHELKHSIVSNLSGNRAKGMKVRSNSGHFVYEYTEATRAYNAFISVAPYWFPFCQIIVLIPVLLFMHQSTPAAAAVMGIAFGMDLIMNIRDISPHQTDFSRLNGGYLIGTLYVSAMNIALTTILVAWILQGLPGLWFLVLHLGKVVELLLGVKLAGGLS